jgi:hypothetical protein
MSSNRIPEKILKISHRSEKKFGKTSGTIKGFCFVISVTGLIRPNDGNDDEDDSV